MVTFILLFLLGVQNTEAVTRSLMYLYTASSEVQNFPEFVAVGLVYDNEIIYFDSDNEKAVPKQDWMNKITEEEPEYWDYETHQLIDTQQFLKNIIKTVEPQFNQTKGVHIFQRMSGCVWDDKTEKVKGYEQFGFDGEDFITLDLESESWTAAKPQAVITKHTWNNDRALMAKRKNYFQQICPEWIKKYVDYGRSFLMRTVVPSVSLLQKTSSSPVSCHATGFYPQRAELMWRKDGEEIHEDVVKGEILPNNDGTFQMTVDLYSVAPEDWNKYECVFQLRGEQDIITRLEGKHIRSNDEVNSNMFIIPIVVAAAVLVVVAVIGFILYKKKNAKRPPSPVETAEVQEQMLPTA